MSDATATAPEIQTQLDRMSEQLDALTAELRRQREQREMWQTLLGDLQPITHQGFDSVTRIMGDLDQRGYTAFARSGLGVVDRVVTSFTEEDVRALGDNIVLILQTVKEMTQPEVMAMLQRTAAQMHDDLPGAPPPSALALARELRDPDVRRGLARLLAMLRSLGTQPTINQPSTPAKEMQR
jgi:uncharacterized protein YjgD (DUF1641 family)